VVASFTKDESVTNKQKYVYKLTPLLEVPDAPGVGDEKQYIYYWKLQ